MMQLHCCFIIIATLIIQAATQTIYVDYDTGKVLGVDEGKQVYQQDNYPQKNWQTNHHRHNQQQMTNNHRRNHNTIPQNNIKAQWVCVNSVTGQSMIINPEHNSARTVNDNSQINNQPIIQNPYQKNPWLNKETMVPKPIDTPQPTIPSRQNIQEPQVPVTTKSPIIKSSTVPDIDWTKFLDVTTKKPTISLETAIDGVGILQPRIFD